MRTRPLAKKRYQVQDSQQEHGGEESLTIMGLSKSERVGLLLSGFLSAGGWENGTVIECAAA